MRPSGSVGDIRETVMSNGLSGDFARITRDIMREDRDGALLNFILQRRDAHEQKQLQRL